MDMYKIQKSELPKLYAAIAAKNDLFLPVKSAGKTNYALWNETAQVDIETLKTVKSPKDAFFPQSENLYTCDKEDGKTTITPEARCDAPFVVFGIKACDVRGIAVLDKVFLSDPVDSVLRHPASAALSALTVQHPRVMLPLGWQGSTSTGSPSLKRVRH